MEEQVFQKYDGGQVTESMLQEAAVLFSENYGVWGEQAANKSPKPGSRVRLSKERLRSQYRPDNATCIYVKVTVDGQLAGNAFACRWMVKDKTVCWVTQLVVDRNYRERGLAKGLLNQLKQNDIDIYGIMSSHPAACLAAAKAFGDSIRTLQLGVIGKFAEEVMEASPINYIKNARRCGSVFNPSDTSSLVSSVNSEFFIDHSEPLEALARVREEMEWPLGELFDGHEFLLIFEARRRFRPGPMLKPKSASIMPLSQTQQELKAKFISTLGEASWSPAWESILTHHSPQTFLASLALLSIPAKKGHLSPKIQAFISLTINASSTHLYTPGIHTSIVLALQAGASKAEILEVIELTSTLGIHACNIGVPLLLEVMKEEGIDRGGDGKEREREVLKEEFTRKRGYWHAFWEEFLLLDLEFFEAYSDFSSVPWERGVTLEPKVKELIYCAFDAAATHLYQPGLKLHMKNAIKYGATPEEITEVLEIATRLSLHTMEVATPILAEHVAH